MKICTVEGCKNKHYARGYCRKHYNLFYRKGLLPVIRELRPQNMSLMEVVNWCLQQAIPGGHKNECLELKKSLSHGYPTIGFQNKIEYVGRLILRHREGDQPGMVMVHNCDNRSCVNPEHLRWDTYSANNIDRTLRSKRNSSNLKLSLSDVVEIRQLFIIGGITNKRIGEIYGVSEHAITDIQTGRRWSHVPT